MTLTNKLKQMRRREEGFTIVELLIVIIVIAILAALVIAAYVGIQQRARDAERQSDVRNIITAVQAYATINDGDYPSCLEISNGTVENVDPEALEPPRNGTFDTAGAVTAESDNYGCVANDDGVAITWWAENPGDTANPQKRVAGTDPSTP